MGGSGDGQEQVVEPDPFVPRAPPKHSTQKPSPASALAVPVSEQHQSKRRTPTPPLHPTVECGFCLPGGQSMQPDEAGSAAYLPVLGKDTSKQNESCESQIDFDCSLILPSYLQAAHQSILQHCYSPAGQSRHLPSPSASSSILYLPVSQEHVSKPDPPRMTWLSVQCCAPGSHTMHGPRPNDINFLTCRLVHSAVVL